VERRPFTLRPVDRDGGAADPDGYVVELSYDVQ
jgi:hypothetical protein